MARKKKKTQHVCHISGVEMARRDRPSYNPYQTGHGVHKSAKYPDRAERRRRERKELRAYY